MKQPTPSRTGRGAPAVPVFKSFQVKFRSKSEDPTPEEIKPKKTKLPPAARTAMSRRDLSAPARHLNESGKLSGRVLDYGSGRGSDVQKLAEMGVTIEGWDKYHNPTPEPSGTYNTIMSNFVLNVIEDPAERQEVLDHISNLLSPGGVAYITVRTDKGNLRGRTSSGTWQGLVELPLPVVKRGSGFVTYRLDGPPSQKKFKSFQVKFFDSPARKPPKKKYGCLMLKIPNPLAKRIREYQNTIPKEHLAPDGLEEDLHITVKYGFVDDDPGTQALLTKLLQDFGPVKVRVGPLSLFKRNEDGDVLKMTVISPQLMRLNQLVSARFKCEDKYPVYRPHLTLAYLKPEFSNIYDGVKKDFVNIEVVIGEACFGDKKKEITEIKLGKVKKEPKQSELKLKSLRIKYRKIMEGNQAWDILRTKVAPEVAEMVTSGDYNGVLDRILDSFYQIDATDESPAQFELNPNLRHPNHNFRLRRGHPSYDNPENIWTEWAKEITDKLFAQRDQVLSEYGDSATTQFENLAVGFLNDIAQSISSHWMREYLETRQYQEYRNTDPDRVAKIEEEDGGVPAYDSPHMSHIRDQNFQERRRMGYVMSRERESPIEAEQLRQEMLRHETHQAAEQRESEKPAQDRRIEDRRRKIERDLAENEGRIPSRNRIPTEVREEKNKFKKFKVKFKDMSSLDETSGGALREPAEQEYDDSLVSKRDDPRPDPTYTKPDVRKPRRAYVPAPRKRAFKKFQVKMVMNPNDAATLLRSIAPAVARMVVDGHLNPAIDLVLETLEDIERRDYSGDLRVLLNAITDEEGSINDYARMIVEHIAQATTDQATAYGYDPEQTYQTALDRTTEYLSYGPNAGFGPERMDRRHPGWEFNQNDNHDYNLLSSIREHHSRQPPKSFKKFGVKMAMQGWQRLELQQEKIEELVGLAMTGNKEAIEDIIKDFLVLIEETEPTRGPVNYDMFEHEKFGIDWMAERIANNAVTSVENLRKRGWKDESMRSLVERVIQNGFNHIGEVVARHNRRADDAQTSKINRPRSMTREERQYLPRLPPKKPKKTKPPTQPPKSFKKLNVKFRSK